VAGVLCRPDGDAVDSVVEELVSVVVGCMTGVVAAARRGTSLFTIDL